MIHRLRRSAANVSVHSRSIVNSLRPWRHRRFLCGVVCHFNSRRKRPCWKRNTCLTMRYASISKQRSSSRCMGRKSRNIGCHEGSILARQLPQERSTLLKKESSLSGRSFEWVSAFTMASITKRMILLSGSKIYLF